VIAVDVFAQCLSCPMCQDLVAQISDADLLSVNSALSYVDLAVHVRDDHDAPVGAEQGVGGTLAALRRRSGCTTCTRMIAAGAADFPFPEEFFNLPDGRRVHAQVTHFARHFVQDWVDLAKTGPVPRSADQG